LPKKKKKRKKSAPVSPGIGFGEKGGGKKGGKSLPPATEKRELKSLRVGRCRGKEKEGAPPSVIPWRRKEAPPR